MAQNDWKIGLLGGLDGTKSKNQINSDIKNLEKSLDKIKLTAELDFKDKTQIDSIKKQLDDLKISLNHVDISSSAISNLVDKINKGLQGIQLNNIGTGVNTQRAGQNIGRQISSDINKALHIDIDSGSIDGFAKRLKEIGVADSTIDETVKRLKDLNLEITKISSSYTQRGNNTFLSGLTVTAKNGTETLSIIDKFNKKNGAYVETTTKVVSSLAEEQRAIQNTANEADRLATILTKVEKARGKSTVANKMFGDIDGADDVKTSMRELERLLGNFDDTASLKDQELAWVKIDNAVKALNADIEKYNQRNGTNTSVDDELAKAEALAKKAQTIKDKFTIGLDGTETSEFQNKFDKLIQDFQRYAGETDEVKARTESLKDTFATLVSGFKTDGDWLPDEEIVAQADIIERELQSIGVVVNQAKLAFDKLTQPVSKEKATTLINRINTFLTKNTAITQEAKNKLQGYVDELEKGVDLNRWNEINGALKETENSMRGLGKLGANLRQQFKQAAESFTQWLSVSSAVMFLVTKTRQAVVELKEVDTLLTEIIKANDKLTKSQLADIGDSAFETASRYGKKATDYLAGVQEMSRAGYQNAEAMGELSVKAQGAGDMTEEVANKFIVATDKAYKLNGSLTDLTKIMDGINYITNHNAINMTELSEGFSIVGSTAASFGVEANELTAALATMGASTQQSGSEVARAFRAILLNIRQVSDEEEGIDAEGLTKYEEACNALGVSLKKTVGGVQELRDPMEVLGELSEKYKELSDTDIKKVNLLNSVGGKLRATQLDALLRGWEDYEKMLGQFEAGTGSMQKEAEKTANSWEGSMNRLSNTWTDTVENIADSDAIIGGINTLNGLLSIVNDITDALGSWGTIGLGAGLFAGIKNFGRPKIFGLKSLNVLKLPNIISVLWDTKVFL